MKDKDKKDEPNYYMEISHPDITNVKNTHMATLAKNIANNKHKYVNLDGFTNILGLKHTSAKTVMDNIAEIYLHNQIPVMSTKDEKRSAMLADKAIKMGKDKDDLKDIPDTKDHDLNKSRVGILDDVFERLLAFKSSMEDQPGFDIKRLTNYDELKNILNGYGWVQERPVNTIDDYDELKEFDDYLKSNGAKPSNKDSAKWVSLNIIKEQQQQINDLKQSLKTLYESMVVRKNVDFMPKSDFEDGTVRGVTIKGPNYHEPKTEFIMDNSGEKYKAFQKWLKNNKQLDQDNTIL